MSRFIERHQVLRDLEGWYFVNQGSKDEYSFKLSCRFNDILRASEFNGKTRHFLSCFRKEGVHAEQPRLRCLQPNWAIIYTPDKHGNFLGRMFVHLEPTVNSEGISENGHELVMDKIYGNKIHYEDVKTKIYEKTIMKNIRVACRANPLDTYLSGT